MSNLGDLMHIAASRSMAALQSANELRGNTNRDGVAQANLLAGIEQGYAVLAQAAAQGLMAEAMKSSSGPSQ
jgi:hypothetical protein